MAEFYAYVDITLSLGVKVPGKTLEEALENARHLKENDVVDLTGLEYHDGSITLTGIHRH